MAKIAHKTNDRKDGRKLFSIHLRIPLLHILNYYASVNNVSKASFVTAAVEEKIKRDCANLVAETTSDLSKLINEELGRTDE